MTKTIVTPLFAAILFVAFTCVANAQSCCSPSFPSYQQFCQKNYANSCVGQGVFGDKLVRPFNHCMSTCCDPCGSPCCGFPILGGGCFARLLGREVNCAGPDFGYVYTPGYGANGQGLAPGWGIGQRQSYADGISAAPGMQPGHPSYIYRSPRDFLNPNPPSIGY